jgi:hypothetical protein
MCAIVLIALLQNDYGMAQEKLPTEQIALADPSPLIRDAPDSNPVTNSSPSPAPVAMQSPQVKTFRRFSGLGVDLHLGLSGAGFDLATPLSQRFNIRTGADFLSVSSSFEEQGADINANLRFRSGHASLDWFPFGGRFRLSPLLVFANNNRIQATALIPPGSTVTLDGQDYVSSSTDPLHGAGLIDFRKVSPGFTLGFGNIIPRNNSHFSVPVEIGFYYVGQPHLVVNFTGSACDPTQPAPVGCESVDQDSGFQHDLAAFIARNNNNLSYASFLPILSVGFGYSF